MERKAVNQNPESDRKRYYRVIESVDLLCTCSHKIRRRLGEKGLQNAPIPFLLDCVASHTTVVPTLGGFLDLVALRSANAGVVPSSTITPEARLA